MALVLEVGLYAGWEIFGPPFDVLTFTSGVAGPDGRGAAFCSTQVRVYGVADSSGPHHLNITLCGLLTTNYSPSSSRNSFEIRAHLNAAGAHYGSGHPPPPPPYL
jgi:hypothetical protein